MKKILRPLCALVLTALTGAGAALSLDAPGYPRAYERIIEKAREESSLSIYSNTDSGEVAALLREFRSLYPGIHVEYADQNSTELYSRFVAENAAGQGSADLVWSSAMDLQIKLINDGYAQPYASPEKPNLPDWAVWKNMGYGVTAEPITIVYNKRLLPETDIPKSHSAFEEMLRRDPERFRGKIATYDAERAGVGFLYLSQDLQTTSNAWDLMRAIGATTPRLYTSTGAMMERVASGEHLIGYNVIGAYAFERAKRDPSIGVVMPEDYTLTASRIAFIPAEARHPNAAKLFLDFLLSARGQELLAERSLSPVRLDAQRLAPAPPPEQARPIRVGPHLLVNLDQATRLRTLKQWRAIMHDR